MTVVTRDILIILSKVTTHFLGKTNACFSYGIEPIETGYAKWEQHMEKSKVGAKFLHIKSRHALDHKENNTMEKKSFYNYAYWIIYDQYAMKAAAYWA